MSTKPIELEPPVKGVYKGAGVAYGPKLTSPDMNNVRPRDTQEKRLRVGQRPGLSKWGNGTLIGGSNQPVVAICSVSYPVRTVE